MATMAVRTTIQTITILRIRLTTTRLPRTITTRTATRATARARVATLTGTPMVLVAKTERAMAAVHHQVPPAEIAHTKVLGLRTQRTTRIIPWQTAQTRNRIPTRTRKQAVTTPPRLTTAQRKTATVPQQTETHKAPRAARKLQTMLMPAMRKLCIIET